MAHSLIFHYRAQNTFLGKSNPLSKLLILIFLCVPLAKASLPYAATVCAVLLCIFLAIRLPLSRFKASLAFFLIIALLIALTEPGGVKASLAAMLRFLDFILLSLLFADTTDPDDLARCLGRPLDAIPLVDGYVVASTMQLTLSMIPLVFDVADRVLTAQTARLSPKRHPVRYLYTLSSGIFSNLLRTAEALSDALDSRLYDPQRPQKGLGFHAVDGMLVIAGLLLAGCGWIW